MAGRMPIKKRIRGRKSLIPPGFCICTNCGKVSAHKAGISPRSLKCPKCGKKRLQELAWQRQL